MHTEGKDMIAKHGAQAGQGAARDAKQFNKKQFSVKAVGRRRL